MSSAMPFFGPLSRFASPARPNRRARYTAGALATLALVAGPATAAQAHVHVHPDSAIAGSDAELAFTVPSESETASTTALSITLPQEHPFLEVKARVTPGWTVKVVTNALPAPVVMEGTTLTEATHTVTWTAKPGETIPPEQYQDFYLSVGPLPDSGEVVFTAKQTYSDGSVVAWDQQAAAGADEPEHPAPSFTVTPAPDTAAAAAETESGAEVAASSKDGFSRLLGGAGLLAGLGAIGLMVARRSPRRTLPRTPGSESPDVEGPDSDKSPNGDRTLDLSTAGTGQPSA